MSEVSEEYSTQQEEEQTTDEMGNMCACLKSPGGGNNYAFETKLMADPLMKSGRATHAAIIGFEDHVVRANAPKNFVPSKSGVDAIIDALKGDTSKIAEDGIKLGGGVKTSAAAKMDAGKAIYGNDGKGGGCTIFKTRETILIVVFEKDPAQATRMTSEVAEHMIENGH